MTNICVTSEGQGARAPQIVLKFVRLFEYLQPSKEITIGESDFFSPPNDPSKNGGGVNFLFLAQLTTASIPFPIFWLT